MSDSDSDESVGARAARDKFQPGTQEDYNSALQQMEDYVKEKFPRDGDVYKRCMQGHKLKMPVDFAVSKLFIRDRVQERMVAWPEDTREPSRRTGFKHLSLSTMCTAVCAMKYSYTRIRRVIPTEVSTDYNNIFEEYKRFLGSARMAGDMPPVEGASPISYDAYYMLMDAALKSSPQGKGTAESSIVNMWLFLIMAWSTLCRGERVGRIQLSFVRWIGDALGIGVPTSKSDAAGLMSFFKLCYSNCLDFASCVVTALGVRVASGLQDSQYLFGTSVGEAHAVVHRMRSALKALVQSLPASADTVLQVKRSLLTMHMPKKSGIRHLNGCGITGINTPIHLRADHKQGPYDTQSDADGVIGRVLADLNPLNLPPPHWHPAICATVPWADFIPSYHEFPAEFKLAVPHIMASVIWHHVALSERLPKSNPLHGAPLWTTHRFWIDKLFPLLIGGTTGTSVLTPSGRNILMECNDSVQVLLQREIRMCTPAQVPIEFSAKQMSQIQDMVRAAVGSSAPIHVQGPPPASAVSHAGQWANVMPLMYLGPEFRFTCGLGLEDAYRRWFCPAPPLPALHLITSKMIPACSSKLERKAQKSLRSKFASVMLVIHGLTPPEICKRNVTYTWNLFWPRVVTLYGIEEPCSWTVSTAVGKFAADKAKLHTATNHPALMVSDVPLSTSDTTCVASAAPPSISSKRGINSAAGRPRSDTLRQRNAASQLGEIPSVFNVPSITPCEPSVLPHVGVGLADDWTEDMYAAAQMERRYKCPLCDNHFKAVSGISKHWKTNHVDSAIPILTAARTRIRVPVETNDIAAANWLDQQLDLVIPQAGLQAAFAPQAAAAPQAASAPAAASAPQAACTPMYQCPFPNCNMKYASTSGIRKHWPLIHNLPCPHITAAGCLVPPTL